MDEYIQIGVTAMRDKVTGNFGHSFPLYARACDVEAGIGTVDISEVAKIVLDKMEQDGNGI